MVEEKERPTGVTILAVLEFLASAIVLLMGLLMIGGGGMFATAYRHDAGLMGGLLVVGGILMLAMGIVGLLVAWGPLDRQELGLVARSDRFRSWRSVHTFPEPFRRGGRSDFGFGPMVPFQAPRKGLLRHSGELFHLISPFFHCFEAVAVSFCPIYEFGQPSHRVFPSVPPEVWTPYAHAGVLPGM